MIIYVIIIELNIYIFRFSHIYCHTFCFNFQTITDSMKTVCEILTADPDGGPARIPFPLFKDIYTYLAQIDGEISQHQINEVFSYLKYDV